MDRLEALLRSGNNIFSINEICLIWGEVNPDALKSAIKYYVDKGSLLRIKRGIYSLREDFDRFELAQRLIAPSYISLETALQFHGIIFQVTRSIQCLARYNREFIIKEVHYKYHKFKDALLLDPDGIIKKDTFLIASPERAITDTLYLYGDYYFDNLHEISIEKLKRMTLIYGEKTMIKKINKLIDNIREDA